MNREQRKDILELVGVVTIIATLVFLVIETRTNTSSVRANAYQTWVSVNAQLNTIDEDLSATIAAGIQDSRNLTEGSYVRFALWNYTFMQMAQATDYMYKMGAIDEGLWRSEINRAAGHLDNPGVREWWNAGGRTQFEPKYVELLESTESTIVLWDFDPDRGFIPQAQ